MRVTGAIKIVAVNIFRVSFLFIFSFLCIFHSFSDDADTCQTNWSCGEWIPACVDGEVEFNYAWNLKDITIRTIRSCTDLNHCGSIIGRPKTFAHCIKKKKLLKIRMTI
ncbi:MAG: hypothetical protein KAS05_00535 [Candidatus Omnitrophica bacterium]|nr:hypothetical protein [Candidatus Omnitrophota bacterium]